MRLFVYDYYLDDSVKDSTCIRAYALTKTNAVICLHIQDFMPCVYVEFPANIDLNLRLVNAFEIYLDERLEANALQLVKIVWRFPLYGANLDPTFMQRQQRKYLMLRFVNRAHIRRLVYLCAKNIKISGVGDMQVKVHGADADPVVQMTTERNIPRVGWVEVKKTPKCPNNLTHAALEFAISCKDLTPLSEDCIISVAPLCMFFDIEVYSSDHSRVPTVENTCQADVIFMISCIFWRENTDAHKVLLTLNVATAPDCDADEVRCFKNENALIEGFVAIVMERQPNVICGYNIFQYDIAYMLCRAEKFNNVADFRRLGFHKSIRSPDWNIKWRSNALMVDVRCIHMEGRLIVDLLPLVQRDFKLSNYQLKTVAAEILGDDNKIDLPYLKMFKMYAASSKDASSPRSVNNMGIIGKYCVKDAELCLKLFIKLQIWLGLTEMARIMHASVHSLYTQGQQFKIFTQVFKYCHAADIVIDKSNYDVPHTGKYAGAHVFPPVAGIYNNVVPFDFSSLYPSIMIAYNFDYSTWVRDESVPDALCNVVDYEEHEGCEHDPVVDRIAQITASIDALRRAKNKTREKELRTERVALKKKLPKAARCGRRFFRFFRGKKGVIPSILEALLEARNEAKGHMKSIKALLQSESDPERIKELTIRYNVYNNRQLSYKIACNSMYGGWGVTEGYLPFLPGAICTTYKGRINIEYVRELIEGHFGGSLVYGDTDSVMMTFKNMPSIGELWDYCEHVAAEVSKRFPPPMRLEFEKKIYSVFLILSKKRYMTEVVDRNGAVVKKFDGKGVLTTRRDNCAFIQQVYSKVVNMMFVRTSSDLICDFVWEAIMRLMTRGVSVDDLVISKSIRDLGRAPYSDNLSEVLTLVNNIKGELVETYVGGYKIKMLPTDRSEATKKLTKRGVCSSVDYYVSCLPSHAQLAIRMVRRGSVVLSGSRIPYVIVRNCVSEELRDKIEDVEYFKTHSDVYELDYEYYVSLMIRPFDEVMALCMVRQFVEGALGRIQAWRKVNEEFKRLQAPCFVCVN